MIVNDDVPMLISGNVHMKSSEVSIKTRSTPASLSFNGQATKHTTVKWPITCRSFRQLSVRKRVGSIRKRPIVGSLTSYITRTLHSV